VAVLISDGRSNIQRQMTQVRADELRRSGVVIHVVALNDADLDEARRIAGSTGLVQEVADDQQAERAINVIASQLCQRP